MFLSGILLLAFLAQSNAAVPWKAIEEGNLYWSHMLGVKSYTPKQVSIGHILVPSPTHSEPSLRLINAALKYQISKLPSGDLQRFSDSLTYLLIYLSGASPVVADDFDRAGWWKLSYPVAMRYGLKVDKNIDERYDFEKSTRAAKKYMYDLRKSFGSNWKLAFLESPMAVNRPKNGFEIDSLNQSLLALQTLITNSNFSKAEEYAVQYFFSNLKYWKTEEAIRADLIIEKTGIPQNVFYALNPDLRGKIIPSKKELRLTNLALANLKKYEEDIILLSNARIEEDKQKLAISQERVKSSETAVAADNSTVYKVKSGDNLGFIAERFGVYVSDIKTWNNLRSDVIFVGQKLVVYSKKDRIPVTASIQPIKEEKAAPKKAQEFKTGEFVAYRVKNGDTLWSIAQKFPGVSPDNLMAWNGITSEIQVGQQIKVLKSEISNYSASAYPDQQ